LGNLETIADILGAERCLLGMTYFGAEVVGTSHVRQTVGGQTFLGEPNGGLSERVLTLAHTFSEAGVPTQATDRLWELVWGKLVINSALNATCALTGASGTTALESEATSTLLGLVADETAAVAAALGIALPFADA